MSSNPHNPESIIYLSLPGEVLALHIPDPDQAKNPKATWAKCQDPAWQRAHKIQVIGSVFKLGRTWHWEGDPDLDPFPDGDPTTKTNATLGLHQAVASYFSTTRLRP